MVAIAVFVTNEERYSQILIYYVLQYASCVPPDIQFHRCIPHSFHFFLNIFLFGTKEENYVEISNVWRAENKDVKCGKNNYYKKHLLKFKFSVKNKNKLSFANFYFFHLKFSP